MEKCRNALIKPQHPKRINEYIILFMGIFSTFQLTEIAGITVYSALLFIYVSYSLFTCKKVYKYNGLLVGVIIISIISEVGLILTEKYSGWYNRSIKSLILFVSVFIAFIYMRRDNQNKQIFLRGAYISCVIQLIWGVLQILLYRLLNLNLNQVIFENIFHMSGDLYHVKYGVVKPSGLNSNVGLMVPIILFFLVYSSSYWLKLGVTVFALFTGSSTPIIAILGYWILFLLITDKKIRLKRDTAIVLIALLIDFICVLFMPGLITSINEPFYKLLGRIQQIMQGNISDGSTYAHFRYYTSIPNIYRNCGFFRILFGYGMRCAGIPYIEIYNQYSDLQWVPESDPVTFLLNIGIIGFAIFYTYLLKGVIHAYRNKEYEKVILLCCLIICGVFYGLQLNWVLMVEYLLIDTVNENSLKKFRRNGYKEGS